MKDSTPVVVIVADPSDKHLPLVMNVIETPCVVMTPGSMTEVSYETGNLLTGLTVRQDGNPIILPQSVWLRVLPTPSQLMTGALMHMFPRASWISPYDAVVAADWFPHALNMARQLHIPVPKTLVTSNTNEALRFLERELWCRVWPLAERRPAALVHAQQSDELMAMMTQPQVLQEVINRSHTVRIVAVGDEMFCVSLADTHPGNLADKRVNEWRIGLERDTFLATRHPIPERVIKQCKALMERLRLRMCTLDFIVDRQGTYVFTGLNPVGDWWFMQEKAGLEIGRSVAALLANS
jgi:hypothetical protein